MSLASARVPPAAVLPSLGEAGRQLLDHFSGSRSSRLRVLLGDLSVSLSVDTEADPADTEMTRNQADKARYYTDKCVKNFLVACWRLRESALGTMTVLAGCLVVSPSTRSGVDLLSSQELFKDVDESQVWVGTRSFWTEWIPKSEEDERLSWPVRKGPIAFYALKRGRLPGLYSTLNGPIVNSRVVSLYVFCGRLTSADAEEWLLQARSFDLN